MNCYIYGLVDPRNDEIRYIGKSIKPQQRFNNHFYGSNILPITRKNGWLKGLINKYLLPELKILAKTTLKNANKLERYYIIKYKKLGNNLTNGTDGGDGWPAGMKMPNTKARKNIILANRVKVSLFNIKTQKFRKFNSLKSCAKFLNVNQVVISIYLNKTINRPTLRLLYDKYIIVKTGEESKIEDPRHYQWIIASNIETDEIKLYENFAAVEKAGFDNSVVRDICHKNKPFRFQHLGWHFELLDEK